MRFIYSFFHIDIKSKNDRNAVYLVAEIFFASIMSAASAFNSAYAIHLAASNSQIGLLSSLPALLALVISIPAGKFLQSKAKQKPIILWALGINRISMVMIALVPFLPVGNARGLLVVTILIVMNAPASFFNVGFIPMLADVIPEENRATVFSARNMISAGTISVCVFLFGQWLSRIAFPVNYQIMFIFSWVISLLSNYFLSKVQVPDATPIIVTQKTKTSLKQQVSYFMQVFKDEPAFMRVTRNTILDSIGLWIATPLYILYFVRQLGASDAWIGLQSTVGNLAAIFGYMVLRPVLQRWGEENTLKRTMLTQGLYPLLNGIFPNLTGILFITGMNSFLSTAVGISQLNQLIKTMPEEKRPEYTAIYYTVTNVGAFLFPMVGVALANIFGFQATLIGCGLLSIIGASSFWWSPVNITKRKQEQVEI